MKHIKLFEEFDNDFKSFGEISEEELIDWIFSNFLSNENYFPSEEEARNFSFKVEELIQEFGVDKSDIRVEMSKDFSEGVEDIILNNIID